ncbi:MAG: hypothetical protein COS84_01545 [Armatimonadetes bacterium CG07_land_8_20_14_0_80_40_9]|nr:MAG: hypothetical protein COS84_01545 [Armatimonadetes bacterium CG07_land_8_20_14_0_80_40_9]
MEVKMALKVKYENGVLRPLEKIGLKENEIYEVEVKKRKKTYNKRGEFFETLAVEEFFKGYSEKDEIYDKL